MPLPYIVEPRLNGTTTNLKRGLDYDNNPITIERTKGGDMKTYKVKVKEVHISELIVKASSPKEAIEIVKKIRDEVDYDDSFYYSHTLDPETWEVEEE